MSWDSFIRATKILIYPLHVLGPGDKGGNRQILWPQGPSGEPGSVLRGKAWRGSRRPSRGGTVAESAGLFLVLMRFGHLRQQTLWILWQQTPPAFLPRCSPLPYLNALLCPSLNSWQSSVLFPFLWWPKWSLRDLVYSRVLLTVRPVRGSRLAQCLRLVLELGSFLVAVGPQTYSHH